MLFFSLFSIHIREVRLLDTHQVELPSLLLSVGLVPSEAPEKEFISEDISGGVDDDHNTLENFDDFDFDNFDELMN